MVTKLQKLAIAGDVASAGIVAVGIAKGDVNLVTDGAQAAGFLVAWPITYTALRSKKFRADLIGSFHEIRDRTVDGLTYVARELDPVHRIEVAIRTRRAAHIIERNSISVGNGRTISYPIDIDNYRSYWGDWDIAREFVSNALDAERGDWGKVTVTTTAASLTVSNQSRPLDLRDLYLGYSSQGKDLESSYLGRFNEGLKLAIAASLREGYAVTVRFGDLIAVPQIVTTSEGLRTLQINVGKSGQQISGTEVTVEQIEGQNMARIIAENIVRDGDPRLLCQVDAGSRTVGRLPGNIFNYAFQVISTNDVFIGGMFVSHHKDFTWGYNFNPALVRLSEGRNMFEMSAAKEVLERSMQTINNKEYWEKIFREARNRHTIESQISPNLSFVTQETRKTIRAAWDSVFGEQATVDDSNAAEARYRQAIIIKANALFDALAEKGIIPNSAEYIENYNRAKSVEYKDEELSKYERAALEVVRKIVHQYLPRYGVLAFDPGQGRGEDNLGRTYPRRDLIVIKRGILLSPQMAVDTVIEELTHARFSTNDTSRKHIDGLRSTATDLLFEQKTGGWIKALMQIRDAQISETLRQRPTKVLESVIPELIFELRRKGHLSVPRVDFEERKPVKEETREATPSNKPTPAQDFSNTNLSLLFGEDKTPQEGKKEQSKATTEPVKE